MTEPALSTSDSDGVLATGGVNGYAAGAAVAAWHPARGRAAGIAGAWRVRSEGVNARVFMQNAADSRQPTLLWGSLFSIQKDKWTT